MSKQMRVLNLCLVMVLVIFIVGCGSNELAQEADQELNIAQIAQYQAPILDWDPAIAYDVENQVFFNAYETLLLFEPDSNSFTPVLATEYSKSEDGLIWTFKLREGVKFHDGTDFNADAVKFSVERTKRINKGAAYIWDPVEKVNVVDDYTVEFVMTESAPLDLIVSCNQAAYILSPTAVGTDDKKSTEWFTQGNMCGTGPYMLQSMVPGNEVLLTKFEDYWGGWEGKHFDKVIYRLVGENSSRRQLMESGEADATNNLLADDLIALQSDPSVQVVISDSFRGLTCFLNTQKPPMDSKLVRQAIAHTFPYQGFVDFVRSGEFAIIGTDPLLPGKLWGSLDQNPYTYDLEKAKALLTEAGYPDGGFAINVTNIAGTDDRKKALELWKSELIKIGVTLDIENMQTDAQNSLARSDDLDERQYMMVIGNWPDLVSPYSYYSAQVKSNGSWSFSYYNNPEIDRAIDEAYIVSGIDRARSEELFKAIGEKVAEECITINLGDDKSVMVLNESFKGFKANPAYESVIFMYHCYRE